MTRALPEELRCQELVELVTEYVEGALPMEERTRFEQHLTYCDGCRAYLDQLTAQRRMLAGGAPPEMSEEVRETLLGAFRLWKKGRT
ncbi:MAG: zf-HC2 domain-containing protein [Polyangiaceae bacterium]